MFNLECATDAVGSTRVLVAGAGPAGLVTAIGLARYGVPVVLVERRPELSAFPRATGVSARSMEILRSFGLERRVRDVEFHAVPAGRVAPSLVSPFGETVPLGFPTDAELEGVSPTTAAMVAQDVLEPVLLHAARRLGVDVRLGVEVVDIQQDRCGVITTVRSAATGLRSALRSAYVVAADGSHSAVRTALGIDMHGPDHLEEFVTTLFRAPLSRLLGAPAPALTMVPGPTGMSVMLPTSDDDRWVHAQTWDPTYQDREDFTEERVTEMVRHTSGIADLPVEVLAVGAFSFAAQVAESFRRGRILLVGDAAHRMTPRGGAGMNTAIHAAHNIAWKLAYVLRGWAQPELLDTYEEERRPVGETNTFRSMQPMSPELDPIATDLGVAYELGAFVGDEPSGETAESWQATGRPGTRLPHCWLQRHGERVSTLDLIGPGFTLFTGREGSRWRHAAREASAHTGLGVRALVVGQGGLADASGELMARLGIESDGAVVVRPDGYVAWRTPHLRADATDELVRGIRLALGEERLSEVA